MSNSEKIDEFTYTLKEYVTIQFDLLKMEAAEKVSVFGSEVTSGIIMLVWGLLFVIFISLGAGFYISSILGNTYIGFLLVAAFYFVVGLILFLGRKLFVKKPVKNKIIKSIFSNN